MASALVRDRLWTAAWCAVALAFPWSNAFMSVATGFLGLVAIIELVQPVQRTMGSHGSRFSGMALVGLVLLSGLSAAWSEEPSTAWNDVRVKLPMLVGGLTLLAGRGTTLLPRYAILDLVKCAVFSAGLATLAVVFLDLWDGAPHGGREASRFISHIRFGLWWAVLLPWAVRWLSGPWALFSVVLAFLTWFWTESLSGFLCGILTAGWWARMLWEQRTALAPSWPDRRTGLLRVAVTSGLLALFALAFRSAMPSGYPDAAALPRMSADGSEYDHYLQRRVTENGHFIWTEIAWGELAQSWSTRHVLPFDEVKGRLIRFLASKGLPKDRAGVSALSEAEVQAVAAGATSIVEWKGVGWARRWNRMRFNWGQWLDGERSGNASLLARSVYQQTAWDAIAGFPWHGHLTGVGSGGGRSAMDAAYGRRFPDWPQDMRHRPHNQWLSTWLELGWAGLVLLLVSGWAASRRPWGVPGVIILCMSFLFEDTLETQAGVTLALWVLALPPLMPPGRERSSR